MNEKLKDGLGCLIIIVVVVLLRIFIITPIKVNGSSMHNTLEDGNVMLLKKYDKSFDRGDIVVIKADDTKIIKRVIGLPKEDIEYKDGILYINGKEMKDPHALGETEDFIDYCTKDEYFVLGDNREDSKDSRYYGCFNKKDILGTTNFILYPFNKWGTVK